MAGDSHHGKGQGTPVLHRPAQKTEDGIIPNSLFPPKDSLILVSKPESDVRKIQNVNRDVRILKTVENQIQQSVQSRATGHGGEVCAGCCTVISPPDEDST